MDLKRLGRKLDRRDPYWDRKVRALAGQLVVGLFDEGYRLIDPGGRDVTDSFKESLQEILAAPSTSAASS